ncbi:hypothetical protein SHKM778_95080 (plasmid) [Streptomyces sp. KM77-8]|uniref:Uncharacterized protein n=1 Tax=Streptomyces haneummycinicus TaxID=3074435 RepID=A0AAT9I0K7_9ACTN
MEMGKAAQKVQRSAHPTLYSGQESEARRIAKEAGINLTRAGEATSTQPTRPSGDASGSEEPTGQAPTERCENEDDQQDTPAKPGTAFHDGNANWPAEVKNPGPPPTPLSGPSARPTAGPWSGTSGA